MTTLRIGGVPEHFNYPWHWGNEQQIFATHDIDLKWSDFPGGTGAMAEALLQNELDAAVLLTEGALHFKAKNYPFHILQIYVTSPLLWGIHVPAHSVIAHETQIFDQTYAISRFGSGSHLMARLHALEHGYELPDSQCLVIKDLQGAISAVNQGSASVFFWEQFTTQPWVQTGVFKRIGVYPTPWPCFLLVVHNQFLTKHPKLVQTMLQLITEIAANMPIQSVLVPKIATRYNLAEQQVGQWLQTVAWATEANNPIKALEPFVPILEKAGIVTKKQFQSLLQTIK